MNATAVDLDAYFDRIGYTGPRTASLDTLHALHALHPAAIPFENLSPFSGAEVPLDLPALERKLVHDRRGGYCFEHNLLFLNVLSQLRFQASGLAARVLWNGPDDTLTPRGHMLLRVEVQGATYLADVGFGGHVLTTPLRIEVGAVQPTTHEPFRVVRGSDGDFRLQSEIRGGWKPLYRFDLTPSFLPDYEVTNYFVSTHPRSRFRLGLIVARTTPGRRTTLSDRRLMVHWLAGESEERTLTSAPELREVLETTFQIRVPESPGLDAALARLF